MSIPKTIHYCWFGRNKKSELIEKCIKSWQKYCPDYTIVCWDEDSFDISSNLFVKEAYENKKWAFVSDYVRLYALYNYGGIYLDTDAEILQNIDRFLCEEAFTGYEEDVFIPAAIMGAEKGNVWIKALLEYYDDKTFIKDNGELDLKPNTEIITELSFKEFSFSVGDSKIERGNVSLFPSFYFNPYKKNNLSKKNKFDPLTNYECTKDTYVIHHNSLSWLPSKSKLGQATQLFKNIMRLILPLPIFIKIKRIYYKNKLDLK
mgnify:FL=1